VKGESRAVSSQIDRCIRRAHGDELTALIFCAQVLGFVKESDVPLGKYRWLTVVAPEDTDRPDLLLAARRSPGRRTIQEHIG
jgi:hypothetical protein